MALLALVSAVAAGRKPKPPKVKERYYIQISEVQVAEGIPAAVGEQVKTVFLGIMAQRPAEFVTSLDGAPDPAADPAGFEKWLKAKKLRAFNVALKLTRFERKVEPIAGKSDVLLTVHVDVAILGASMPATTLAMAGDGTATVAAEVSKKVPPKVESAVVDEALHTALTKALDKAVTELRTAKPMKPKR